MDDKHPVLRNRTYDVAVILGSSDEIWCIGADVSYLQRNGKGEVMFSEERERERERDLV